MLFSAWQYHTGAGPMTDGPLQAFQVFSTAWPAIQMLTDAQGETFHKIHVLPDSSSHEGSYTDIL